MERKQITLILVLACAAAGSLFLSGCAKAGGRVSAEAVQSSSEEPAEDLDTIEGEEKEASAEQAAAEEAEESAASEAMTAQKMDIPAGKSGTGSTAGSSMQAAAPRTAATEALEKQLREELENKAGKWSLYVYRFDTGEAIRVNADEPMISASLIKLFVAGSYLDQVEKGEVPDDYQGQLFAMLSASDNGATNHLIDVLGMDRINEFMKENGYKAGRLSRRMLEKNGTENYTSSADCGRVLRKVYQKTYVNKEASDRIRDAMMAQIERNRHKIPAGVPDSVEIANKTGELFTVDSDGVNVNVQNDAAIIFAPDHAYVMVVMSSVPGAGEGQLHQEIAALSAEVYETICSSGTIERADAAEAETGEKASETDTGEETGRDRK